MNINITKAQKKDCKLVYDLSNSDEVRACSINSDYINWEEHVKWFNQKINDEKYCFFVVYNKNENFIGQIRFEILDNNDTVISMSIKKEFRRQGLAKNIFIKTKELFLKEYSGINNILAYIKPDNIVSIKFFESLDFNLIKTEKILLYRKQLKI